MAVSDPIADMLTKVRNANMAKHEKVDIPMSKMKLDILNIMKTEGYIKNYKIFSDKRIVRVFLRYMENEQQVIKKIERISTPGRRMYVGCKNIPLYYNGLGTVIISSSEGIITGKLAKKKNVGGEILCAIW